MRTTGHGFAAGIGKLGAFVGVFLVPALELRIGLRGMLAVAAASAVAGLLVTLLLPEAAQRSLDDVSGEVHQLKVVVPASSRVPDGLDDQPATAAGA
jgi:uncharacterized membrane protein YccC